MPTEQDGRATYRVHSDTGRGGVRSTTYVRAESWERAMDAVKEELDGHAVSAVYETDRTAEGAELDAREVLDDLVTDGGRGGHQNTALWYCRRCDIAVPDDGRSTMHSCPECRSYMSIHPSGGVPETAEVKARVE